MLARPEHVAPDGVVQHVRNGGAAAGPECRRRRVIEQEAARKPPDPLAVDPFVAHGEKHLERGIGGQEAEHGTGRALSFGGGCRAGRGNGGVLEQGQEDDPRPR